MTWQTELLDALPQGDRSALADVVIRHAVREQRALLNGGLPALTVRGAMEGDDVAFFVQAPGGGSWKVTRPLDDLINWAHSYPEIKISLLGAVSSTINGSAHWDDEEWLPFGYVGSGAMPGKLIPDYVPTDRDERIASELAHGQDVLLVGRPASGKTLSALEAANQRRQQHGDQVIWLDLTDAFDNAEALMLTLLMAPRAGGYLVVIDNLQANVTATFAISRLVVRLRAELRLRVRVLATCWSTAVDLVGELPLRFSWVAADGTDVIHRLLAASSADPVAGEFDALAGGDVLLAKSALRYFERHGRMPHSDELADAVAVLCGADQVSDPETRRVLYWFASLGEFEIGVWRQFCETAELMRPLQDLVRRKVVSRFDELYTIGHPSKAAALVRYAVQHWDDPDRPLARPSKLAYEYLRRAGRAAAVATLEKLDLINHGYGFADGDRILTRAWPHRGALIRYLKDQALVRDHTWGGNTASAMFAGVALALLDQPVAWKVTADYVRGQWDCGNTHELPVFVGARASTDSEDVHVHILQAMRAEDVAAPQAGRRGWLSADDIDLDRFYRTWNLGLLLTFEHTALERDATRIAALKAVTGRVQLPNGAFYPERVPWMTARVLNGLWHGGDSRDTSPIVNAACDWLRTPIEQGGPFDGCWHSGTGAWNSDVMTTAMCMTALMHAGVPASDHCVRAGYEYLKAQMPQWRSPGREIDCATAAEALMLAGPDRREVYPAIMDLLGWVSGGDADGSAALDESVKIPFIAEQVVWIVQGIVQRELEALLRDFEAPARVGGTAPDADAGLAPHTHVNGTTLGADSGTPPPEVSDRERRRRAVECMGRIVQVINDNIASRELALSDRSPTGRVVLQRGLDTWLAKKQAYDDLNAQLADRRLDEVIAEVDRLAFEILPGHRALDGGAGA